MSIYVPGKVVLRQTWQPMDPDAAAYIAAVEAADTAAGSPGGLEEKVKIAIDNFVLGCKADGTWSAIKASCILAGARTLDGCLVPLVGTAPSQVGTTSGWNYARKTGLAGNGIDNYLNSNRANNADPQNSKHLSVYVTQTTVGLVRPLIGNRPTGFAGPSWIVWRADHIIRARANQNANTDFATTDTQTGFKSISRASSEKLQARYGATTYTVSSTPASPLNENIFVFSGGGTNLVPSTTSLAFYSIGEALDLALLDARVTTLINAIAAAIP